MKLDIYTLVYGTISADIDGYENSDSRMTASEVCCLHVIWLLA